MTVEQLAVLKRWHVAHRRNHPVEFHVWDLMLTCWVLGWMGLPAALIVAPPAGLLCVLLFSAPTLYVGLRRSLHRRHRLRCDWLGAAPTPQF
jgi:hypothetical protein